MTPSASRGVISPIAPSVKTAKQSTGLYKKLNVGEDQQQYVRLAQEISNSDLQFLYMLEAENSLFTPDRQSNVYYKGRREPSFGFCQIHKDYHPEIINNPKFKDPKWQMETCFRLFKGGTKFYGYQRVLKDWRFKQKIVSHFQKI